MITQDDIDAMDDGMGLVEFLRDDMTGCPGEWDKRKEAADRIASLSAEVERLKEKQRIGLAAAAIVTEIAACVPLKDTIEATRTGRTLVDWVKSTVAHAESAAQKMREALEREHRT